MRRRASTVAAVLVAGAMAAAAPASTPTERLLVVATAPPSYAPVALVYDGDGRLLERVPAPRGSQLTWSPDGRLLAVATSAGVSVEHVDGTGLRQLLRIRTACKTNCLSPPAVAWTPDGRRLAVGGADPKSTGFDLVDVGSGHVTPLWRSRRLTLAVPIAFSPNGRLLAYTLESGDLATCCTTELVVARADGTRPRVLHRFGDPIHDGPGAATWSPDSTRIAFTDDGRDPKDPRFAIVDVASGKLRALAPHRVYDQSPAWSPDGKRLALGQYKGPAFVVGADGSGFRPLGVAGTAALWLRDGDLLVATGSTGHRVAILRGGHGPAGTLFTLPGRAQLLSLREAR